MASRRLKLIVFYPIIVLVLAAATLVFALLYGGEGAAPLADAHEVNVSASPPTPIPSAPVVEEPAPDVPRSGRLLPYLEGTLWGYKNTGGQVVVPAQYSKALEFDGEVAFAAAGRGEKLYGLIDRKGNWIVEPAWQDCRRFSEGRAAVKLEKWGYIGEDGGFIIEPKFREAYDFHCGRARIRDGGLWGYIDMDGEILIKPQYSRAQDFAQDYALATVTSGGKDTSYIIDKLGERVARIGSHRGGTFSEGLCAVLTTKDNYSYIDTGGDQAFAASFEGAGDFALEMAPAKQDGKWGYIGKTGSFVITKQFDDAKPFSGLLAAVKVGEKWGYIDDTGALAIAAVYDEAQSFIDGYALVKRSGEYGVVDERGNYKLLYVGAQ